jgi:NAD-dependent deacetylase
MENQLTELTAMIRNSRVLVALTGAGISTESGIPDFRSPGGIWSRYRPVTFPEFLSSKEARTEYWKRYVDMFPMFTDVRPNAGHYALARLEKMGKLKGLITQNVDRLHHTAGNSEDKVIELHGRVDRTSCLSCGQAWDTGDIIRRVTAGELTPECPCGGILKPATISFGQNLPQPALEKATRWSMEADLFLAIGSSLTVHPAASLPEMAAEHGAALVILNAAETPLDRAADLVIKLQAGPTLKDVIERLDRPNRPH